MIDIASTNIATVQNQPTVLSASEQAAKRQDEQRLAFLNLFMTSLQHQDPTNPQETSELAMVMSGFSQVEQSVTVNENLERLIEISETTNQHLNLSSSEMNAAANYIGKFIVAGDGTANLSNGKAEFIYTLPEDASQSDLVITNQFGKVVRHDKASITTGAHSYVWDGKDDNGVTQDNGVYSIKVTASKGFGTPVTVYDALSGTVSGLIMDNGQAKLLVGANETPVSLDKVVAVKEAVEE